MTHRILPPEEWSKLRGTLLESVTLPAGSQVVVVEENGRIVSCGAFVPLWHLEGVWNEPSHRASWASMRRLVLALRVCASAFGITSVWSMVLTPGMARMCQRFGTATKLDCDHYEIQMKCAHGRLTRLAAQTTGG